MLACLAPTAVLAQAKAASSVSVTWEAPEPLRTELEKLLPPPVASEEGEHRAASIRPWVREVRRRVPEIAASEGYFSATVFIDWEPGREQANVVVVPGARTVVSKVEIEFAGDVAGEGEEREARRREAREAWALKEGMPF